MDRGGIVGRLGGMRAAGSFHLGGGLGRRPSILGRHLTKLRRDAVDEKGRL
jgi:hypothetical protein